MKILKCSHGHYFDSEKFKECPVCAAGDDKLINDEKQTKALFYTNSAINKDRLKTKGYFENNDQEGRTIGIYRIQKVNPVAGWIVCLNGPCRGKFFAIYTGKNYIGSSRKMDIVINSKEISEENHACIIYDYKNIAFYITELNGRVQLNQNNIVGWNELHTNDSIIMGDLVFDFIPYCNKERNWNESTEKNT